MDKENLTAKEEKEVNEYYSVEYVKKQGEDSLQKEEDLKSLHMIMKAKSLLEERLKNIVKALVITIILLLLMSLESIV